MITEVLFNRLALKARVAICGSISSYEGTSDPKISIALGNLVPSRAKVEGFLVSDYSSEYAAGRKHLVELLKQGKLKSLQTTTQGIENAGLALAMLFDGRNNGKMQCRLVSDAEAMAEVRSAKL
jgi:NADPH-dependent curcumin reductase CurA